MLVKCGRDEIDLNENDEIMFNGAWYQIITRKVGFGWNEKTPIIAKAKAEKMIKDGLLVFDHKRIKSVEVSIYKIATSQ